MAADVIFLTNEVAFQKFHLVGVSMGGMIAQHVALIAPQVRGGRRGEGEKKKRKRGEREKTRKVRFKWQKRNMVMLRARFRSKFLFCEMLYTSARAKFPFRKYYVHTISSN
jgi:pimeloyl-ACP methyl ester carboxylesterase